MIIGLDLSINSTGICLSSSPAPIYYIVTPKLTKRQRALQASQPQPHRISYIEYEKNKDNVSINIRRIADAIEGIIKENLSNIEYVVIEDVALAARGRSIIDLTLLNGYIRCLLDRYGVSYITVPPTQWKKQILGNGQADKELIVYHWARFDQQACQLMFAHNCKCDDIADAYFLSCYQIF